jgi:1,4-alpha-glucan branching enzyme
MRPTLWWQTGVVYQVYPRSFGDSNGDGVGDLEGIRHHLDYLAWLGVDAIWISPFYRSPMKDFGYDVADYTDVDALFGDLAAFDRLLADAHARELRGDRRLRPQPHIRSARLVHRITFVAEQRQARLVRLA